MGWKIEFSRGVTRVRLHTYRLANNDSLYIYINGVQYPVTAANLSAPTSVCSNISPVMATPNGAITSIYSASMCSTALNNNTFNAQTDIATPYLIDSVKILGRAGPCGGDDGSLVFFAIDTLAYIPRPLATTSVCAGDTIRLPYYVSNFFNSGNVFTAQLSNAAGSFSAPVNIGSRADVKDDTIVCVIPRTTAGGTGYRIRIVSSNPSSISFDNGTNIQVKALAANRIISSNSPVCEPDTVRLFSSTSTTGTTFSWAGPLAFTANTANAKTGNSTTAHSGQYIVTMTTTQGCVSKDTTTVLVKPLPQKPVANNDTSLCTGATLNLSAATSTSGVTWAWTGPNSYNSTAQNPSRTGMTTADAGNYIVTATLNGCSRRDTTNATVFGITAIPTAGNSGPYCIRSDIELSATSIPGATYTWSGPNGFTSNTRNPIIPAATLAYAGTYSVYATVNGCNGNPSTTTVSMVTGPTVNIYPSPNDTVCGNVTGSATFNAIPAGAGTGFGYQWYKNGNPIAGPTNSTYAATGILSGDVYNVKLIPGSGAPCNTPVNSNSIAMTVLPFVTPGVTITVNPDSIAWSGLLLTFTATATNAGANPTYQWKRNNQSQTGATSNTWGAPNLTDNDKITCEVTSSYICPQPSKATSNTIRLKISTGIKGTWAGKVPTIYPNPVKDLLMIEGIATGTTIQLTDVAGRTLIRKTAISSNETLNIQNLISGNYILLLDDNKGNNIRVKITKE